MKTVGYSETFVNVRASICCHIHSGYFDENKGQTLSNNRIIMNMDWGWYLHRGKKQEEKEFEIKVLERELKRNNYNCMAMY